MTARIVLQIGSDQQEFSLQLKGLSQQIARRIYEHNLAMCDGTNKEACQLTAEMTGLSYETVRNYTKKSHRNRCKNPNS